MSKVLKTTGTIWENYAPEVPERGNASRGDFVGWSECGPIALLIENVIGIHADGASDILYWRLRLTERHGIENLRFGDNKVSIVCNR